MATAEKPEFPVTLVHDDLPGREITAATRTSLRAHEARGWKPKPAKKPKGDSKS